MEEPLDIKFFPGDTIKSGYLGGGYIRSGLLKTRFSVFVANTEDGIRISLPSTRKPEGGWDNHVEFRNRDAVNVVVAYVKPLVASLLSSQGQGSSGHASGAPAQNYQQAQQAPQQNTSQAPTRVSVQAQATNIGTPF